MEIVPKEVEETKEVSEDIKECDGSQHAMSQSIAEEVQEQAQELPYDQLKMIAIQATQQTQKLQEELQGYRNESLYVRLDFLFKVIQFNKSFPPSFVNKCAKEIEKLMTLPE